MKIALRTFVFKINIRNIKGRSSIKVVFTLRKFFRLLYMETSQHPGFHAPYVGCTNGLRKWGDKRHETVT